MHYAHYVTIVNNWCNIDVEKLKDDGTFDTWLENSIIGDSSLEVVLNIKEVSCKWLC